MNKRIKETTLATEEKAMNATEYVPSPAVLDDVNLPESLVDLTEAIAKNTHDTWAKARMDQGWTYGPMRNDIQKKHPDLIPYSCLSDEEKEYDRASAMSAIKLIVKLGYSIHKA